MALDWWSGNRVPHANSALSGVLAGLTLGTNAGDIYRALLEGLCFGTRSIVERLLAGGLTIERILLTSGLATNNRTLVQLMADVLGREIAVPLIRHPTAVGAAIHGAVAGGVVSDFADGAARFGGRERLAYHPDPANGRRHEARFRAYGELADASPVRDALLSLRASGTPA